MSRYKLSDYLTIAPHKDEYLLAQGVLGKTLVMRKKLFDEVARYLNKKGPPEIEKAKKRLMEILAIVPEILEERQLIMGIFNHQAEGSNKACGRSFVLTLRCNFACPYCFENEKKIDMKKEVIDKALSTIFQKARRVKSKTISISFYGGEPLLNFKMLEYAVRKTRAFCGRNKIKPLFDMITNGSLFTQRVVDLFSCEKDLENVQVTLDGPKEIHDQRRFFKGGNGSYEVIMKNLPLMFKAAKHVAIRINVDEKNKNSIPKLFAELRRMKKRNLIISLGEVATSYGRGKTWRESIEVCNYARLKNSYYEEVRKLGLRVSREKRLLDYRPVFCAASHAAPHWIAPDGGMYCCAVPLGNKPLSIGNIFTGYDEGKARKWLRYNVINNKKCIKCKHIFFCGGPCPARVMKGEDYTPLCGDGFKNLLQQNFDRIKKPQPRMNKGLRSTIG